MFDIEYVINHAEERELKEMSISEIGSLLRGYHILYICASINLGEKNSSSARFHVIRSKIENRIKAIVRLLLEDGYTPDFVLKLFGLNVSIHPSLLNIIGLSSVYKGSVTKASRHLEVVIVGFLCSGKDIVASLMRDKLNASLVNFSDLIKDVLAVRLVMTPKRADYYQTGETLRYLFGRDILSRVIRSLFNEENSDLVFVGPRFLEEVKVFKKAKVIGVRVDPKDPEDNVIVRFYRYKCRNKQNDVLTLSDFLARELEERKSLQEIFSSDIIDDLIINNDEDVFYHNLRLQIGNLSWTKN